MAYNARTSEVYYTDSITVSSVFTSFGFYTNGIYISSDSNVKENISSADLSLCYSNIKQLPLRRFNYIPSYSASKVDKGQLGFIAQEVYPIFPRSVFSTFDQELSSNVLHLNFDQIFLSHYGTTQLLLSTVENQQTTLSYMQLQTDQQESTIQGQNTQILTLISSYQSLFSQVSTFIS